MRNLTGAILAGLLATIIAVGDSAIAGDALRKYYVPDGEAAIKIAEAVLVPIYGKRIIESERPFRAELRDDVWYVRGNLPEGYVGGVAMVALSRIDAHIISVGHGK